MKSFKGYLSEAYNFFPKSEEEIKNKLSEFPHNSVEDIINLFNFLKGQHDTPINIDLKKPKNVNVSRFFKGTYDISDIKTGASLSTIKIKFGNGALGNRGANNRGNAYETEFANAIEGWYSGENLPTGDMLSVITGLDQLYNLSKQEKFDAKVVGGANTPRPIIYGPSITLKNTKGIGNDIGASVTDITLETSSGPIYLSLKTSTTTTFFNVGVKKVITKKEIDNGAILNANGIRLLDLFGIDNERFCTIFNDAVPSKTGKVNVRPNVMELQKLLESGIGHGYHVIHRIKGKTKSYVMDETKMRESAKIVGPVTISYGGKTGRGKRVDMEMKSRHYKFKLNIRDTQGGDGYPTRMMCDFTTL